MKNHYQQTILAGVCGHLTEKQMACSYELTGAYHDAKVAFLVAGECHK